MTKASILIIDDEEKLRSLLSRILRLEGFKVFEAGTGEAGLQMAGELDVQVIITDVRLPDISGLDLVSKLKKVNPVPEIIVLTAFGNIPDTVTAIKAGAFDYLTKGDQEDLIVPRVERALEKVKLTQRILFLEKRAELPTGFESIHGKSAAIQSAIHLARKVAPTETPVLLLGETGTGKEVFASAIHQESLRKDGPFVAVNCSAIAHDLLESEMFGYKAGAFTGAMKDKKGLFEEAQNGTLLLDEAGDLNLDVQAKLLRVLETGTFIKPGDTKLTQVNVRIIAATNRDLKTDSETGSFRSDLYYRLSAFTITLPPLRERKEDIQFLAEECLKSLSLKMNRPLKKMSTEFAEKLITLPWPGNIRELKNVLERAIILCDGNELTPDLLPVHPTSTSGTGLQLSDSEKHQIETILTRFNWDKPAAAKALGIGLTTLYRKIKEYGLKE
ncbi:MAG: sigma-54 dependent transcriptional regulator [Bacteroidetes bacterium]|nr:sigma-54 dependent transcriptional regulator [Bacteroidota bacterium]